MKTALLTLLSLFFIMKVSGQSIALSLQANSGLFHYSGKSATTASTITEGESDAQDYTNNPYGSKNGFSYGGDVQAQFVSKNGFIFGLQAGYELLRSQVEITDYEPAYFYLFPGPTSSTNTNPYQVAVKGQTFLQDQDININPYVGYRLQIKKIKIDLMPGIDLGFNVNSYDKGKGTASDGTVYRTDLKLPDAPTDIRLRFGVAALYNKWGITASFADGLSNLDKNTTDTGSPDAHSELIRFGITYRIL
jgi:hypothetical protein